MIHSITRRKIVTLRSSVIGPISNPSATASTIPTEPYLPPTHLAHFFAASNITPATTPGCVAHPQCPTSLSTISHSTPDPSMNACAVSGVNVPSSIALSQILRSSRAFSAHSGGKTGVVMHCSACGMCVFARASCSEGSASLKRWGIMGSKTKRPGAGYASMLLELLHDRRAERLF